MYWQRWLAFFVFAVDLKHRCDDNKYRKYVSFFHCFHFVGKFINSQINGKRKLIHFSNFCTAPFRIASTKQEYIGFMVDETKAFSFIYAIDLESDK